MHVCACEYVCVHVYMCNMWAHTYVPGRCSGLCTHYASHLLLRYILSFGRGIFICLSLLKKHIKHQACIKHCLNFPNKPHCLSVCNSVKETEEWGREEYSRYCSALSVSLFPTRSPGYPLLFPFSKQHPHTQ